MESPSNRRTAAMQTLREDVKALRRHSPDAMPVKVSKRYQEMMKAAEILIFEIENGC